MPDDSKKNQNKGKHEAKEQRKPRQRPAEKKQDKKGETKNIEKKTDKVEVPTFEEPGPEFYKGLKRETDEILKITEEANAKYKKKEIQSNWSKYEMPIESYEEINEQENLGADYEKLTLAPTSAGGHFQFKHEKTWDINTAPSLYDKYFDFNMDELANAISTIPFYERNSLDQTLFCQTDLLSMNHRAVKYKRKYYNDSSYGTTPDMEAHDKILHNMIVNEKMADGERNRTISESKDIVLEADNVENTIDSPVHEGKADNVENIIDSPVHKVSDSLEIENIKTNEDSEGKSTELKVTKEERIISNSKSITTLTEPKFSKEIEEIDEVLLGDMKPEIKLSNKQEPQKDVPPETNLKVIKNLSTETKKPVIESPEDLEKWLDDFLDG